jgi:hypothetical protein
MIAPGKVEWTEVRFGKSVHCSGREEPLTAPVSALRVTPALPDGEHRLWQPITFTISISLTWWPPLANLD